MSNACVNRHVTIIDAKDANVDVIQPQLAVLMVVNPKYNGKRYLDVGSLCYGRRDTPSTSQVGCPVDLSSLDNARIPFVQALIEYFKIDCSSSSTEWRFHQIKVFVDWIDAQEQHYAFDDVSVMKQAYVVYTRHLLHRMNSSGIRGLRVTRATASAYQASARTAVMLTTGLSAPEVKSITTLITQKSTQASHVNLKLPNSDVQAQTFAALINYIDEAHRVLVGGGAFPLHLVSPNDESFYLYSLQVDTKKSKDANFSLSLILSQLPAFPTWNEIKVHLGMVGRRSAALLNERSIYDNAKKRYERNNKDLRSELRRRLGNHAVVSGMLAFIAATGSNLSVAQTLEIDTLEIVPSTQGKRFSGTKWRAGGKTVYPEFGTQFVPVFKKYLELRQWVLNGSDSVLVFPVVSSEYGVSPAGANGIVRLKAHFAKTLPKTVWITSQQWRKNVSYQYVKRSGGDMALTAEKLGNTEATLRQNYSRPALEDYAAEMVGFFEAMHQTSIERTRTVERIPVRILDEKKPEAITGTGLCEKVSEAQPERAQGFTALAPTPTCRDPESCLFCAFYAIHADEEDVRRLLSLRYLIQATKNKQPMDQWQRKFGPTVHRIDEVLSAIQGVDPASAETINRVRSEVESGDLDIFWSIHFDTLVTVGAVS